MKPKMYIFLNKGLGMSTGKSAAQAGHAAVEATLLSKPEQLDPIYAPPKVALWEAWREGLHYAKYVMEADSQQHMQNIERYLIDRGFRTALIIDEGHTEVAPLTITAMGVALVDGDDQHTRATFSSFKLYKDPKPPERPQGPIGRRRLGRPDAVIGPRGRLDIS
jgi:peptidyl-tRNA hydrolase, PTH2 family